MRPATPGFEAAKHSPVEKDVWEIISGHCAATMSDRYGGKKPDVLVADHSHSIRHRVEQPVGRVNQRVAGQHSQVGHG